MPDSFGSRDNTFLNNSYLLSTGKELPWPNTPCAVKGVTGSGPSSNG